MRIRFMGAIALMALAVASCGGGASEAAGPSEGIQVHGDWTIDIYNADGTLEEHMEFSNALLPSGAAELVYLLSASHTSAPAWQIVLHNPPLAATTDPCGTLATPVPCVVNGSSGLSTLYLPDEGRIHLDGSFTADIDGHLRMVKTMINVCSPGCGYVDFTETAAPLTSDGAVQTVDAGQTVQIQVDISFASG